MKEARLGEVDITDVDPDTLKKMLEFIYTGQVANCIIKMSPLALVSTIRSFQRLFLQKVDDGNYTAELLYAADKYELDKLVNILIFVPNKSELNIEHEH